MARARGEARREELWTSRGKVAIDAFDAPLPETEMMHLLRSDQRPARRNRAASNGIRASGREACQAFSVSLLSRWTQLRHVLRLTFIPNVTFQGHAFILAYASQKLGLGSSSTVHASWCLRPPCGLSHPSHESHVVARALDTSHLISGVYYHSQRLVDCFLRSYILLLDLLTLSVSWTINSSSWRAPVLPQQKSMAKGGSTSLGLYEHVGMW